MRAADAVIREVLHSMASLEAAAKPTGEAMTGAFEDTEEEARALADAIEHVADVSFADLKDAAKEAGRAIRDALAGDANRTIRQLRREEERLEQQRLKAQRTGKWEAYWLAEARLEEVRAALTARRQARRHFVEERAEMRQRRRDVNTLIEKLDDLWEMVEEDATLDIDEKPAIDAITRVRLALLALVAQGHDVTFADPWGPPTGGGSTQKKGGKDKVGALGAVFEPGDYGWVGEAGMERIHNVGGTTVVSPVGPSLRGGERNVIHTHVYLDRRQIAVAVDEMLGDMYTSAGSGAMSRAS
jgi:hypothetical protein